MAQIQQTILVDDIDGGDAVETVSFGLDGASYEIDLNAENAAALRDALSTWVGHARRSGGRRAGSGAAARPRAARSASSSANGDTAAIRAWAKENGHEVSERGRISSTVLEAYKAAND
jgi:hypothetical protein